MYRIVVFFAALASASISSAATIRNFAVGNWVAGAYTSDSTREFSHCVASAPYKSGITVFFSIDRNFHWSMGFSHPAWRLTPGSTFDVAFTVDNMNPLAAKAVAISRDLVRVNLDDNVELFARFRRGHLLSVAAASQVFSFSLTGTSRLLPALLGCARDRGVVTQMAANPFVTNPESARSGGARDAQERAEATTFAANLLSLAGVQGFRLLGPSDYPAIKGQARWIGGQTFGTVNVFTSASAEELKNLPSYLIGADAKACKGTFFSGAIPDSLGGTLARVFTTCEVDEGKTLTTYYMAVPRKAGGVYVVSTISVGSEQPAKQTDSSLRSAVLKVSTTQSSTLGN